MSAYDEWWDSKTDFEKSVIKSNMEHIQDLGKRMDSITHGSFAYRNWLKDQFAKAADQDHFMREFKVVPEFDSDGDVMSMGLFPKPKIREHIYPQLLKPEHFYPPLDCLNSPADPRFDETKMDSLIESIIDEFNIRKGWGNEGWWDFLHDNSYSQWIGEMVSELDERAYLDWRNAPAKNPYKD